MNLSEKSVQFVGKAQEMLINVRNVQKPFVMFVSSQLFTSIINVLFVDMSKWNYWLMFMFIYWRNLKYS